MISAAWGDGKPNTVRNCFRKAGWKKDIPGDVDAERELEDDDEEEDLIPLSILRERLQLPETLTFDDYVSVDDDLLSSEELTEADILAELFQSDIVEEEVEAEEEEVSEEPEICTLTDAKKYLLEVIDIALRSSSPVRRNFPIQLF